LAASEKSEAASVGGLFHFDFQFHRVEGAADRAWTIAQLVDTALAAQRLIRS
jgi:hypothetical protein